MEQDSLKQIKLNYTKCLEKEVMPVLQSFEKERKQRLFWYITLPTVPVVATIAYYIFLDDEGYCGMIFIILISVILYVCHKLKKNFENKIKRKIMPELMKAFQGFRWQLTPPFQISEIDKCLLIPQSYQKEVSTDDCFVGEYNNVKIDITECEFRGSKYATFKGSIIKLKMNKNFNGLTIIQTKDIYRNKNDLIQANLQEVKLEDSEFDNEYAIYSTNQIEARYLITPTFMERFKQIRKAFGSYTIYCAFYNNSIYIAPYSGDDLFNLCSLTKSITDKQQYDILFKQFTSILALVDHFKLDQKLGL